MEIRKPFVYLAGIAIILALIGVFMLSGNLSGKVVMNTESLDEYSLQEVNIHNVIDNCWIIDNNLVYDVTLLISINNNFYILKDSCGKDAASLTSNFSPEMKNMLDSYKIGILA